MERKKFTIWSHRNNHYNSFGLFPFHFFLHIKSHLYLYVKYFERGLFSDVFAGHNVTFCSLRHSMLPPHHRPPNPNQPQSKRVVGWGQGWELGECLPGLSPISLPVPLPAKLCAFLLQLSEGLTKGEVQLCSNILIIYCSAAHIIGHHHPGTLIRTEEEFSLSLLSTILFNLVFPSSSHVLSHGFRHVGKENAEEENMAGPPFFLVGIRAFKMCSSPLNVIVW